MPIKPKGKGGKSKIAPQPPSQATHACPACQRPLTKLDRRRREGEQLLPLPGVMLIHRRELNQAPYLRCVCGHVLILLPGSAG